RRLADGAQHAGQFLGTDDHDHDDRDHQHLRPGDVKHGVSNSRSPQGEAQEVLPAFSLGAETVSSARCSTVFGSSSSSDMPFLKLLMPLAMSPISSGILPRPNRSSTTTSTISQCQMEKLPIIALFRVVSHAMIYALSPCLSNTSTSSCRAVSQMSRLPGDKAPHLTRALTGVSIPGTASSMSSTTPRKRRDSTLAGIS